MLLISGPHNERIDNHCLPPTHPPRAFQGGQSLLWREEKAERKRRGRKGEPLQWLYLNNVTVYSPTRKATATAAVAAAADWQGNQWRSQFPFGSGGERRNQDDKEKKIIKKGRKEEIDEKVNFKWTSQGGRDLLHCVRLLQWFIGSIESTWSATAWREQHMPDGRQKSFLFFFT